MTTAVDTHPAALGRMIADYVAHSRFVYGRRHGEPGPRYPALASVDERAVRVAIQWARSRGLVVERVEDGVWSLWPGDGHPTLPRAV